MDKSGKKNPSFVKSLIGFSMSAWVTAAISFFATPIVTRAFLPEELGKINMFITIVNIFMTLAYLGVDQAFTRFYHEPPGKNDKKSLLSLCMIMTLIIFILICAGIIIFGKSLSMTIVGYVTYVVPAAIIISIFSQIILRFLNLSARMEKNMVLYNIQAVISTVLSHLSYVAVVLYSTEAIDAIIFRTLSLFVFVVFLFFYVRKRSFSMRMDYSKPVIKDILLYALPLCPASVLSVLNNSIGQLILKRFLDYSAIGIYSNAVTVSAILTLVQNGFNNYWGPFVYENYKTEQKKIIRVHHILSFGIIFFGLTVIFFQDVIYYLLIGRMYWASKQIFPLLIISPICYTIAETLGIGIRLAKNTYLNIPVAAVNLVVNIGLSFLLIPRLGVVGAAAAAAASSLVTLLARAILGEKRYRCSDNYVKLIVSLVAFTAAAVFHVFIYTDPIKYLVYAAAMIIVCLAYRRQVAEICRYVLNIAKGILKK